MTISRYTVNTPNHPTGERETDSSPRERHGYEHEDKASNGEEIRVAGRRKEFLWLKSLMVFCTSVSVVGLRYVVNTSASAFRRSVWVLLILFGVVFTTYQIQDRIRYYFGYPVRVVIHEEYMEEMIFPTVTICNENRLSLSKMSSMGKCRSLGRLRGRLRMLEKTENVFTFVDLFLVRLLTRLLKIC